MEIDSDIKPFYASLRRLKITDYLMSEEFEIFLTENDWDDFWIENIKKSGTDQSGKKKYEDTFKYFLSELYNKEQDFESIFLGLICDFAEWNKVPLDTYDLHYTLKDLGIDKKDILELEKDLKKIKSKKSTKNVQPPTKEIGAKKILIVHGHDDLLKNEVARFIEKLRFEPIILHEQANSGKTIIEKIEEHSNISFGVVLYTPCDVGAVKGQESKLNYRARQNVVFEHGYLMGKIGRKNVTALVKGTVEKPNDISGVVYIPIDGDWKIALAKELNNCGYKVDMNLIIGV